MASKDQNAKLNRISGWLSPIKGSKSEPELEVFEPHLQGIYNGMDVDFGGETGIRWSQLFSLFQIGQISQEDLTRQFDDFFQKQGKVEFAGRVSTWRRDAQRYEQLLAGMRATALLAPAASADDAWLRYRAANISRQLCYELAKNWQLAILKQGNAPGVIDPYEYSPEALKAIRERIAGKKETGQ